MQALGLIVRDASRATNVTTPMSGAASTARRRDVGSVPVWTTWPRTALLVRGLQQVRVIEAPKEAPKAKEKQKMARTTRAT